MNRNTVYLQCSKYGWWVSLWMFCTYSYRDGLHTFLVRIPS
jgi:hypothetical protein